jgi:acetoin utilization protein AcuB
MPDAPVELFMVHSPHTIAAEQPLRSAHDKMRVYGIRHLPVLVGEKLVGIVSQRDLHFIEALSNVDLDKVPVSDAMTTNAYTVGPRTALRKVAAQMASHRYGCAVVVDDDRVVGIFTTTDGMRALALLLSEQRHEVRES